MCIYRYRIMGQTPNPCVRLSLDCTVTACNVEPSTRNPRDPQQILALTLLYIHTLPGGPLPGEKPVAFCRTLVLFSKRKLQKLCVGRWGPM